MKGTPIKTPTYVNSPGIIRTDFWTPDFDVLVDNKGYDVVWEKAVPCPCGHRQNTNQSSCRNCLGTGWVFINPMQIKAIATSLNRDTKYKEWSQEMLGTASFTVRHEYHLNFMDRLTILNSSSMQSENLIVKRWGDRKFVIAVYPIDSIREIFRFVNGDSPLELISDNHYTIENNFIRFDNYLKEGDSISVTYEHKVQYHIIDLNHDVRNTIMLDNQSREQDIYLPIAAVGRRVQYVLDAYNYSGDNIIDNSYSIKSSCG